MQKIEQQTVPADQREHARDDVVWLPALAIYRAGSMRAIAMPLSTMPNHGKSGL